MFQFPAKKIKALSGKGNLRLKGTLDNQMELIGDIVQQRPISHRPSIRSRAIWKNDLWPNIKEIGGEGGTRTLILYVQNTYFSQLNYFPQKKV